MAGALTIFYLIPSNVLTGDHLTVRSNKLWHVFLPLWLLVLTGCQQEPLQQFSSSEGQFSVSMPGSAQSYRETGRGITVDGYMVQRRSGAMSVSFVDLDIPLREPEEAIQDRLDRAVTGTARSFNATKVESSERALQPGKHPGRELAGQSGERALQPGKYPGRELTAELPGDKGRVKARFYLVGRRLYEVMVVGSASYVNSEVAGQFLDSFALMP
jgi:hypothetical protein